MSQKQIKILVAGEDHDAIHSLAEEFRAEKFQIVVVHHRESVLALARSEEPSLILLEFEPCFDLCRSLKRSFITEYVPIIALLTSPNATDRVAIFELGADDCLTRPFSFRQLLLRTNISLQRAKERKGKAQYDRGRHHTFWAPPSRKNPSILDHDSPR